MTKKFKFVALVSQNMRMKTILKQCFGLCLCSLCFSSCVDDQYSLQDIDTTVQLNTEIVGPLAHSHLLLSEFMPTNLKDMEILQQGDEYYIAQKDTQDLGNDLISNIKITPSGEFVKDIPFISLLSEPIVALSEEGTPYDVNRVEEYQFEDLNTNPNERLDSILFDQSPMPVTITSTVPLDPASYLEVQPIIRELKLDLSQYPNNTVHVPMLSDVNTVVVNTLKSRLYLRNGTNTIHFLITGKLIALTPVSSADKVTISINFNETVPYITYVNVRDGRDLYDGTKEIDFDYTEGFKVQDGFFPFYNPIINTICQSNIGLPARYYVDYVEAYDSKTGESVRADFGGTSPDTCSVIIEGPEFSAIEGKSDDELFQMDLAHLIEETKVVFDRNFGHTDRLFKIKADKLRYKYRIRSIEKDSTKVHFVFQSSDMKLLQDTYLGLRFEGDANDASKNMFLVANDTLEIAQEPISTGEVEITPSAMANLDVFIKNFIGLGITGRLYVLDENYQPILEELETPFSASSAKNDGEGNPQEAVSTENAFVVKMNAQQLQTFLDKARYLRLNYVLSNENRENVYLKTHNWVEAKVRIHVRGGVIIHDNNTTEGGTTNEK